jgi:hypothetical protein
LCAWLAWAPLAAQATPSLPDPPAAERFAAFDPEPGPGPGSAGRLLTDIGVAAAGTLAVAALKPDIRRALARDASLANVLRNFADPVGQVRAGTRRDSDPFWVNGLAHPGLFALEALYLKRRGRSDLGAFAFTQAHSLLWEFAVEGAAFEPSGKDLLADAAGAAAGIWLLRPLAERSQRRLDQGRGRAWDHALRWLDPVSALAGRRTPPPIALQPLVGRSALGLQAAVAF